MTDSEARNAAIQDIATGPKQVSADGVSMQQQSVDEIIRADQFLSQRAAASKNHLGLSFRKMEPGGTG